MNWYKFLTAREKLVPMRHEFRTNISHVCENYMQSQISYCPVCVDWFPINNLHTHMLKSCILAQGSQGELIVYPSSRRPCVRPWVRPSTISNMNISAASGPIATKFYLKPYWGRKKAALGFGPDQTRTLVSMATDSSL